LLSILLGLQQPDKGVVRIGNARLDAMPKHQIAETFALAGQTEVPFNRSLRENVRYGRPDATNEEVDEMLRLVGLLNQKLPGDLDTTLGSGGCLLSGGQRQRVLIARALLRDPPILVMDEATSALDYPSETALLAMVAKHRKGKTTIIVTHRPSALPAFDHVVVIEDGRVIENGPPSAIGYARCYFDFEKETLAPRGRYDNSHAR
jgi:ATP-binding cassette subfamily B protein